MSSDGGPLVGLVVVSHSRALAHAAVALASQMLQGSPVPIAVAAGLDSDTLGTDAVAIKEAIEQVDSPAGVVVLMDLGSAVLSAELALELLEDFSARDRVVLSAGPLVEGLVVAAVAAAGGAGRAEVAAEAQHALLGKAAQLAVPEDAQPADSPPGEPDPAEVAAEFSVLNPHGLHARPAARLVGAVRGLDAQVRLRNLSTGAGPLPAGSLSRVATLGALQGHRVEVLASGPQAAEAVERLLALAARRFDEPLEDAPEGRLAGGPAAGGTAAGDPVAGDPAGDLAGVRGGRAGPLPASPGIAVGPARVLTAAPPAPRAAGEPGSPADEWRRLEPALAAVRGEIESYRALAGQAGPQEAGIFDAHLLLLDDAEVLADVQARLATGADAGAAWADALAAVERQWSELPDPYLRARAEDVRAVSAQVLAALTGAGPAVLSGPGILVAKELTPGQAAELDADAVQGIVLAEGSPSSHAAILARSRGIPAVVAAGPDVLKLAEGTEVALDGGSGELIVDPPAATVAAFRERAGQLAALRDEQRAVAGEPACTADGARVEVAANVGSRADALAAAADGADSAGLVRTEFLFLNREVAPDVEEQIAEYLAIAHAMPGRRITLRTLDVGGDKPLSYLPMPAEDNPFLGRRGIRLALDRRELLLAQLTAICEVARQVPVSVMFPMVSTVAELHAARRVLDEAAGGVLPDGLRVGVMVEVPAAALKIATLLPHVDFVSVGTNDLTQYTLAAERGNAAVAALWDPLDPGVLSLIRLVCGAAGEVPVAVCGEAAADPAAVPLLLGLGVRELSVSPRSVPSVKARVRGLELVACRALAETAVGLDDAAAVRGLVSSALPAGTSG